MVSRKLWLEVKKMLKNMSSREEIVLWQPLFRQWNRRCCTSLQIQDLALVWKKLVDQYQKRTWANKLALRRKLYSLRPKDGDSIQKHIKEMTEIFDGLAAIDDPITEEDRVVHLLASLPESYNVMVTALEANVKVPKMETVTERLLHEERKIKERKESQTKEEMKAMLVNRHCKSKGPKCYHCGKFGHIKRNCKELNSPKHDDPEESPDNNHEANSVSEMGLKQNSSDSNEVGLMANGAFRYGNEKTNALIIDSGATCHTCNDATMLVELYNLEKAEEVTLGDGYVVKATGRGHVNCDIHTVFEEPESKEVYPTGCSLHPKFVA